jgi:rhodanese-related sulfurtransferase
MVHTRIPMKPGKKKMLVIAVSMAAVFTIGSLLMWHDIRVAPRVEPSTLLTGATPATPRVMILDVRSIREYEQGHVPGAKRVPFWSPSQLGNLQISHDAPVVVYCELGPRAAWAKWTLQAAGFRNMAGWREAGLREESSVGK